MEIKEFIEAKKAMENEIMAGVAGAIMKFRAATGYSPGYVNLHMAETTQIGDKRRDFILVEVTTSVEL